MILQTLMSPPWDKETGLSLNSFWRTKELIICVVLAWHLTLKFGDKSCFSWTFGVFLSYVFLVWWLVGSLVCFSSLLFLFCSFLIYHYWKVVHFRLLTLLAFSFSVPNFLTFFHVFVPEKSLLWISLSISLWTSLGKWSNTEDFGSLCFHCKF